MSFRIVITQSIPALDPEHDWDEDVEVYSQHFDHLDVTQTVAALTENICDQDHARRVARDAKK